MSALPPKADIPCGTLLDHLVGAGVASGHAATAPPRSVINARRWCPPGERAFANAQTLAPCEASTMCALGHKRTCASQNAKFALAPIATAKADSLKRSCLLCPQKRTCAAQLEMSALGHKRPFSRCSEIDAQSRIGVARLHSITSVAATSRVLGNVSPNAFAVF